MRKNRKWLGFILISTVIMLITVAEFDANTYVAAKEKKETKEKASPFTLPENVLSLKKDNTFPNVTEDIELLEPSKETKELLQVNKVKIDNPDVIKLLNESVISPSPIAIGYRATIYLGRWPLHYESEDTSVIWDYQEINKNELNNQNGETVQELSYIQQEEREVKGALTNKMAHASMIQQMMLESSQQKTKLPLAFATVFGANTKLAHFYNVPKEKFGTLQAYAPAVNEKGKVVFGEVYIRLKGSSKELVIKNVTKQGIGAWIPIQDHISLNFQTK